MALRAAAVPACQTHAATTRLFACTATSVMPLARVCPPSVSLMLYASWRRARVLRCGFSLPASGRTSPLFQESYDMINLQGSGWISLIRGSGPSQRRQCAFG